MAYNIIAIDGGGIRGLISAMLLKKLDGHCDIVKNTDLFAGTASGSVLALALAQGLNIGHIMALFEQKGEYIFDPAPMDFSGPTPLSFEQQTALNNSDAQSGKLLGGKTQGESIKSLFQSKYRSDNFKQELVRLFGALKLSELPMSGPQVMVEAMQLWSDGQGKWAPVSIGSGRGDPFADMLAIDAALCSCATPTYFPPHKPEEPAGTNWGYFAGGSMYANNPTLSAARYAVQYFGAQPDELRVLSLGSSKVPTGIPPQDIGRSECWGGWQWIRPYTQHGGTVPGAALVEAAVNAAASQCDAQARMMLGEKYIRADFDLTNPCSPHDWDQFDALSAATEEYFKTDSWKQIMDLVASNWTANDDLAADAQNALSRKNRNWFATLFS